MSFGGPLGPGNQARQGLAQGAIRDRILTSSPLGNQIFESTMAQYPMLDPALVQQASYQAATNSGTLSPQDAFGVHMRRLMPEFGTAEWKIGLGLRPQTFGPTAGLSGPGAAPAPQVDPLTELLMLPGVHQLLLDLGLGNLLPAPPQPVGTQNDLLSTLLGG